MALARLLIIGELINRNLTEALELSIALPSISPLAERGPSSISPPHDSVRTGFERFAEIWKASLGSALQAA